MESADTLKVVHNKPLVVSEESRSLFKFSSGQLNRNLKSCVNPQT